jgi:hypothetical protein
MKTAMMTLAALMLASGALAEPIEYWKCGPFNIQVDRDTGVGMGATFDITKGREVRKDQYEFLREKAGKPAPESTTKFVFWSGVLIKDHRRSMAGTLETDLTTGRTTYTEESFIGWRGRSLGKVVKTCTVVRGPMQR